MEEAWFGSSYYELLYHHRSEEEASERLVSGIWLGVMEGMHEPGQEEGLRSGEPIFQRK